MSYAPRPVSVLACLLSCLAALAAHLPGQDAPAVPPLKIGMIGLDTSHVIAFTKIFNDPKATGDVATMRVVAGYPGGTDVPASKNRVVGFTNQLREMGVAIVDSIPALLARVDVVLLESVDGRPHLEQVRPVFAAGKRVFIDKPLAGSLADALEIDALARKHGVPWFSSSAYRFGAKTPNVGKILGCVAWSPATLEPTHPDLFWYGIHGVESLLTVMGPGCVSVRRTKTADTDIVTGVWKDGRVGSFRGLRAGKKGHGAMVFGSRAIAPRGRYEGYKPLVAAIARFFRTGEPPVTPAETLEIYAFMAAAHESSKHDGRPVTLASVLAAARPRKR